ncbi:MAG: hypothetical protein KDD21_02640 [Bacteroidetes bacterium]|nr:hypothetical protein [Bacteroidota bacterium]
MNTYVFDSSTKSKLIKAFLVGLVLFIIGVAIHWNDGKQVNTHTENTTAVAAAHGSAVEHHEATAEGHHVQPTLKTLIVANTYNVFYFGFYIALAALFFLAATNVAWGGWHIQIQKIPLAISVNIALFLFLLIIMFIFFNHDIFHWTHEELFVKGSPTYDKVLDIKSDFLNLKTFWVFTIIITLLCLGMAYKWWNTLNLMDTNPTRKLFSTSRVIGGITIVVIAFIINTFATWFWSMSIQPHWYSTMFTWNTMAGASLMLLAVVLLFIHYLKSKGYLPNVNENHKHDVAKLMFAISIFWCYTWFAQYMLIWYSNLPEETEYFRLRRSIDNYGILFHLSFILNFVMPFLILLSRGAKRNDKVTIVASIIVIVGQFSEFFLMNCPALLPKGGYGIISFGLLFMIGSVFVYLTLTMLSKVKDLASTTHPYVKESYNHHI